MRTLDASGDVPMTKVKIGANQEYQYITNFKVLQKAFKDHGIDKVSCLFCSNSISDYPLTTILSLTDYLRSPFLWTDSSSKHSLVTLLHTQTF